MLACKFIPALLPMVAGRSYRALLSLPLLLLLSPPLVLLLSPPLVLRGRVRVGVARKAIRSTICIPARVVSYAITLLMLAGCHNPAPHPLKKYEYKKPEMGTVFQIVLYAPDKPAAQRAADAAFARAEQLNAILSDYDPTSELSRLSLKTDDGPMPAPVPVS